MFKLAHISDIHLGPLPALTVRELASKRITGYLNWHRNRRKHLFPHALDMVLDALKAEAPDHLAITGDLVNLATNVEIHKVTDWLAEAGAPLDTSVVPGNHDAYVPGAHDRVVEAWYDYMRGDDDPLIWHADHKLFPYIRRRGPVALIGCSTSIATPPFSASGYFSARQARETANLLKAAGEEGLFRVVMIHHPPIRGAASRHKRMIGIRRFAGAIRTGGAELVLHGHTHLNTLYWLTHKQRKVPVVGISSASQGPGGKKPAAGYNLFSIEGEAGNWQVDWKRFIVKSEDEPLALDHQERLFGA
ncbi:metallophosphoesterase [Peteryoungia desertarenae]|uniref:Metallophosphoesterase n=1 Tax=Peteryoungia desertarenae TaxID=1813451 RepID=A0ABX6QS45_9HYPH|nr:metallophosphoesterase [Peteryoungia desertarenae]QLF71012.1 metallophosphoesterase [Peteryoungia desertarenae]